MHIGRRHPRRARFLILFWIGVLAAVLIIWGLALWGGLAFWNILNSYYGDSGPDALAQEARILRDHVESGR